MTILINQSAVDFTLEQETTYAALVTSLQTWAASQNLAILGILADGRALPPDDTLALSTIQLVEVEVVGAQDEDLSRIEVLERYFVLVAQGVAADDNALLSELRAEYAEVRKALFPLLEAWKERLEWALEVVDGNWDDLPALGAAASAVVTSTGEARRELLDPAAALEETLEALDAALANLEDLGTLFHRGRDKDALEKILGLFTLLGDAGRRAPVGWRAFFEELQPFLKETEQALALGDYILLADLLEYEVSPRIRDLKVHASRNFQP